MHKVGMKGERRGENYKEETIERKGRQILFVFVRLNLSSLNIYGIFESNRIDDHMEESMVNVEGAQGQLLKYLTGISSNRWLMVKIFMVLVIFLLVFVVFIAQVNNGSFYYLILYYGTSAVVEGSFIHSSFIFERTKRWLSYCTINRHGLD